MLSSRRMFFVLMLLDLIKVRVICMEKMLNITIATSNETATEIIARQQETIHKLTSVITELPGSIYWKDAAGVYLGNNHFSTEKMKKSGFAWQSIIGKTDYDLFSQEVADQYREFDLAVMKAGQESVREESITLPAGEVLVQLSYKRPLYDTQGTIVGIIGNTIDITYLKKIERESREAKDQAERANQSKIELLRHMEHDIRTPFNGIWTLASLLASRETNEEKKLHLEDISKSAKQLLDYCNDILYFARTNTGTIPFTSEKFNIKALIRNVITMENIAAKSKNLKLLFESSVELPDFVISDPKRIQKILLNLVSNAIKFTEQGYVKISLMLKKKINDQTAMICLIVEDTGIGIPAKKQIDLYEHSKKSDIQGFINTEHGLGLPTVKLLIQELGGELDLESELEKGTKFIFNLLVTLPKVEKI